MGGGDEIFQRAVHLVTGNFATKSEKITRIYIGICREKICLNIFSFFFKRKETKGINILSYLKENITSDKS